ncbi:MAG: flagellar protein FlaG [Aquificaceae bacterium]|nr:flagellar protein FlaG [Aquificaceae bacterium]
MRMEPLDVKLDTRIAVQDINQNMGITRKSSEEELQQAGKVAQKGKVENFEEIQRLMEEIRRKFDMLNKYLRIDIDRELEIPVAKIIEKDTNRVIRQIPPDYLLDLMKKVDQMLGVLLEKEV